MASNTHTKNLIPLLANLSELNASSANDLLQKICKTSMSSELKLFWKLSNILNNPQKFELFDKWLHDSISNRIPKNCDPFISSMFSNNKEKVIEISKDISPYLQLIFASPPNENQELKDIPSFLLDKEFNYGDKTISGSCVWSILMGDITGLIQSDLNLHWSLLFALHYWYTNGNQTNLITHTFLTFRDALNKSAYDVPNSPIFLLFQLHSDDFLPDQASTILSDIASLLPPIDMYLFLRIYKAFDFRVTDTSISLALDILKYTLMDCDRLPEVIDLLVDNESYPDNGIKEICTYCITPNNPVSEGFMSSSKFSPIENNIIQKCSDTFSANEILFIKADKSQILQEQYEGMKSLEYSRLATQLLIEASGVNDSLPIQDTDQINAEYFELANYQAFKIYLSKAMAIGEEISKGPMYNWSSIFAKYPEICQSEDMQTYTIIEALKKVENGEEVSQSDLETIGEDIHENNLPPRFKLYVVSKLCNCPKGYQIFGRSQATPKDKLLEHYEKAFP